MLKNLKKNNITDALIIVAVVAMYLIFVNIYSPDDLALVNSHFHPFLFVSVLFSAYYGTKHAIAATVVFNAVYFTLLYMQVDFQAVESIWQARFLELPIHITLMSIVVGEIRQRTWNNHEETRKILSRSERVSNELKKKTEVTDLELTELQKRYATLTKSFESNLSIFESLEGKPLKDIINLCNDYFERECQASKSKFIDVDLSNAHTEEKKALLKLNGRTTPYTLRDDIHVDISQRILTHIGAEIVAPLIVNNVHLGWFLLFDIPFLALNIHNQQKIENMMRLVSLSLRNHARRIEWEAESPLIVPYNIFKKADFFDELEKFYQSLSQNIESSDKELFYLKLDLHFGEEVEFEKKEKIYLVLTHLARKERDGAAPIGGTSGCHELYYSYLSNPKEAQAIGGRLVAQFKTLVPEDSTIVKNIQFEIYKYKEKGADEPHLQSI